MSPPLGGPGKGLLGTVSRVSTTVGAGDWESAHYCLSPPRKSSFQIGPLRADFLVGLSLVACQLLALLVVRDASQFRRWISSGRLPLPKPWADPTLQVVAPYRSMRHCDRLEEAPWPLMQERGE